MTFRYRAAGLGWRNGATVNMSGTGILVGIPDELAVGARVEIAMDWPGVYHGAEKVRLFLLASVARVDASGTALRIHQRQFCVVMPRRAAAAA